MKKIKINFVDFWEGFNVNDNFITKILNKYFDIEISDNPDYVFCSVFGKEHLKYNDKVKIEIIGENMSPDFNLYDYAIGFYDISFGDRYLKYNFLIIEHGDSNKKIKDKYRKFNLKKKFCAFVYTNNKLSKKRIEIFNKISEYKKVDSGSELLNNIGYILPFTKENKLNFQKDYKFIIACENQKFPDYNTEKLYDAFISGGIPIYWGDPNINNIYNKKAYINCDDYDSLDDVLAKVIELDNDDKKYKKMLNEPIYNKNYSQEKENKKFEDFLVHIFNQDLKDAKRIYLEEGYYYYKYVFRKKPLYKRIYLFIKRIIKK